MSFSSFLATLVLLYLLASCRTALPVASQEAGAPPVAQPKVVLKSTPKVALQFTASSIYTVEFHQLGSSNSYPTYALGSSTPLLLSFDDLDGINKDFQYTIQHCDRLWKPSNLFKSDYIDGVFADFINDFRISNRAYVNYMHYNLLFPNQNMRPKISGNYLLKVYLNDEEQTVLTRRFYVVRARSSCRRNSRKELRTLNIEIHIMRLTLASR